MISAESAWLPGINGHGGHCPPIEPTPSGRHIARKLNMPTILIYLIIAGAYLALVITYWLGWGVT